MENATPTDIDISAIVSTLNDIRDIEYINTCVQFCLFGSLLAIVAFFFLKR